MKPPRGTAPGDNPGSTALVPDPIGAVLQSHIQNRIGLRLRTGQNDKQQGRHFWPGRWTKVGMNAEIAIDWPHLMEDLIRLQLVLEVTIAGSHDGMAEARIWKYDFRIRPAKEPPKQIALQS